MRQSLGVSTHLGNYSRGNFRYQSSNQGPCPQLFRKHTLKKWHPFWDTAILLWFLEAVYHGYWRRISPRRWSSPPSAWFIWFPKSWGTPWIFLKLSIWTGCFPPFHHKPSINGGTRVPPNYGNLHSMVYSWACHLLTGWTRPRFLGWATKVSAKSRKSLIKQALEETRPSCDLIILEIDGY